MTTAYPRFKNNKYKHWFKHWLLTRFSCSASCLDCAVLKEIIDFGTRRCLESLFLERTRFYSGSNVVGLGIGQISKEYARTVCKNYPYVKHCESTEVRGELLKSVVNDDFPSLNVYNLPSYSLWLIPLMDSNEHTLYGTLSRLYKVAVGIKVSHRLSKMSIIEYVLLCFHLNSLLLFTADTLRHMWSETLKLNSIILLYEVTDSNFDALGSVL